MKFVLKFFIVFSLLFLSLPKAGFSKQEVAFVAYESIYIPHEEGNFIELSLWYPTPSRSSSKQLYSGGDSFYVTTRKPKVYDREYDLILLSPPTYADRYSFSKLSYALARAGFLVASLTHNGDNWSNMKKTMTANQYPSRAEEIIKSIEYVRAMKKFSINANTLSVLSFEDTAFAPFLLHNEEMKLKNYVNYCRKYQDDAYCNAPINQQIYRLLADIEGHTKAKEHALAYLKEENALKLAEEKAKAKAKEEAARRLRRLGRKAQEIEEEKVEEVEIVEENIIEKLSIDKYLKTSYPFIKNYFIVEPSFAFLFNREEIHEDKYKVLAIYSLDHAEQFNNELEYLSSIYPSSLTAYALDIRSGVDLTDRCVVKNRNSVGRFCSKLSNNEHEEQIDELIEIITENL